MLPLGVGEELEQRVGERVREGEGVEETLCVGERDWVGQSVALREGVAQEEALAQGVALREGEAQGVEDRERVGDCVALWHPVPVLERVPLRDWEREAVCEEDMVEHWEFEEEVVGVVLRVPVEETLREREGLAVPVTVGQKELEELGLRLCDWLAVKVSDTEEHPLEEGESEGLPEPVRVVLKLLLLVVLRLCDELAL